MTIGELIFQVGFKADTLKLKDFGKAVSELNLTSILTAGSFGAVYEGAKALVGVADDMALGINKFGRETGQSTQEIQKWNRMAEQMGVSSGTVAGTVASLEDSLFKMKFTGEGSNIWAMLKLDPTHTSNIFQVLTMLRDRLKGMSTEQQRFFLENLGISTEMLNMFKLTDSQWADISKQQTLSGDQLDQMSEYHKKLAMEGENLKLIWADLGIALLPIIESLVTILNDFDATVLKSWEFKGVLDTIAEVATAIAKDLYYIFHPGEALKDIGKTFKMAGDQYSDWGLENKNRANRWAESVIPSTLFGPHRNQEPSPVNVTVKVNKAGPETTVETTTDQDKTKKNYSDIVNQLNQGYY